MSTSSPNTCTPNFLIATYTNDNVAKQTNASCALEIQTTTGAVLFPRMTTTQKNALTAVNGMIVYDSTLNLFEFYQGGAWGPLAAGAVNGPGSSTNTAIVRWNGVSGALIEDSTVLLDNSGNMTALNSVANGAGLVATPSYTFTGNLNAGMWSSAANTVDFSTNSLRVLQLVSAPALSVNYLTMTPSATGNPVIIASTGTDAAVNIQLFPKGTTTGQIVHPVGAVATPALTFLGRLDTGMYSSAAATIDFASTGGRNVSILDSAGTTVNYITLKGSVASSPVVIGSTGTDAAVNIQLFPKGTTTGQVVFPVGAVTTPAITFLGSLDTGIWRSAAATIDFASTGGRNLQIQDSAGTTVNYVTIKGSVASSPVVIGSTGSDSAVNIQLFPKGTTTGQVVFPVGAVATPAITFLGSLDTGFWRSAAATIDAATTGGRQFQITNTATAVDWIAVTGAATNAGNAALQPSLVASGSDTVIDVAVVGKGANSGLAVLANSAAGAGAIKLWNGGGTFYTQLKSANVAANKTWTLPLVDSTYANSPLVSNASAVLSFNDKAIISATITLAQADVQGMYAAPIQIVAAPASGQTIIVESCQVYTNFQVAAFANGGVAILQYGNAAHGAGTNALTATIPAAEITAGASQIYGLGGVVGSALTGITAAGLFFSNQTGAFTGGNAASTVIITVQYYVLAATV